MYGIAVEYEAGGAGTSPDPLVRAACQALLVRQPGYQRRLALVADGWRRIVDLYLFATPEAVQAALGGETWRAFIAAHPACRAAAPALLVHEGPCGDPVILLRGSAGPTRGGQACRRDRLARADPEATLW